MTIRGKHALQTSIVPAHSQEALKRTAPFSKLLK
jgi:hypothetical protein